MQIIGVIPARYNSTRFPGKPLVIIDGKTMIQRVYTQSIKCKELTKVIVATDDKRIFNHVKTFSDNVIMTSALHQSGTDRCAEIAKKIKAKPNDVIINIQGDEPYIQPKQIKLIADYFKHLKKNSPLIATLVKRITHIEQLSNSNVVKVILNKNMEAIYFSRAVIPFQQNVDEAKWLDKYNYYKHIGIYGYQAAVLKKIIDLPLSLLENTEKLEQLRWLDNGYKIKAILTTTETASIDTPNDIKAQLPKE